MKNKIQFLLYFIALIFIVFGIIKLSYLFKNNASFPRISIEYKIKPENIEKKIISVNIRIYRNDLSNGQSISLAKGSIDVITPKCVDQNGRTVPFKDNEGIITIGPITKDIKYIDYTYKTNIGKMIGGKIIGDLYDDLMVFSGENVLLFPYFDNDKELDSIEKYIDKVAIQVEKEEKWNAIIPYQQNYNAKQDNQVVVKHPDWYVFYNLAKSCYAFGNFEPLTIHTIDGDFNFLIDVACKEKLTSENVNAMTNIYNFYTKIFGKGLIDYPVILLRRDKSQDLPILGGVGGKSLGVSLDMKSGEDWYTFSHTLYHAFFDSKIHARNLHYPPNLWLYKGLSDYYVDKSATILPRSIRDKYDIEIDESLESVYTRYIYFSLKEPILLKVSPALEGQMLMAQSEYYYNTKVPLVIDAIENMVQKKNGTINNLINDLIKHSDEKNINIANIMVELLGSEEAKVRAYLGGEDIIPYWRNKAEKENTKKVILELDQYERLLTSLFQNEIPGYPYDPVVLLKPEQILKEIQERKLKFGSEQLQQMVRNYSETVYLLLMQNALRADICGEKDLSSPEIRLKLNSEENIKKWSEYVSKVGLYGSK